MGTKLKDLIAPQDITLKDLAGKVIAIDAFNYLYQFLTTIRQSDGTPLQNAQGVITSHLTGLFFRTVTLLANHIRPVFVFDGVPPQLKQEERKRRQERKAIAQQKYLTAVTQQDIAGMRTYASQTSTLTAPMVEQSKQLIRLFGLPIIEAPGEGEAQAAELVKQGKVYAAVSQDYDSLLFGCPRLIRNLSVEGRRKRGVTTVMVSPQQIVLQETLSSLHITQDQLICIGMLSGTDYNYGGIPRIGPKKALALVRKCVTPEKVFEDAKWQDHFQSSWQEVFDLFKIPNVSHDCSLVWETPKRKQVEHFLVDQFGFSSERVHKKLEELPKESGLGAWLK